MEMEIFTFCVRIRTPLRLALDTLNNESFQYFILDITNACLQSYSVYTCIITGKIYCVCKPPNSARKLIRKIQKRSFQIIYKTSILI